MAQLLLTHDPGVSISSLPRPYTSTPASASIHLALPSRFPPNTEPCVASSSSGHIFLYAKGGSIIWEYDEKARRVSEIGLSGSKRGEVVERVLPLGKVGKGGKETVLCEVGTALRVMEKDGAVWSCTNDLKGPNGHITALACDRATNLIVAGNESGELVAYDQMRSSRTEIPLHQYLSGPISHLMAFSPSIPATLVIPTGSSLLRVNLLSENMDIREVQPFVSSSLKASREITDLAFSPVVKSSDGTRKGGLCAVLNREGEVVLVGLDYPDSAAKLVSFESESDHGHLAGVVFLDGATLAARTRKGILLVKDLRALSNPPVEVNFQHPITNINVLPVITRSARPSASASRRTSSAMTVLGENRNIGNSASPLIPPLPSQGGKGKQPVRSSSASITHTTSEVMDQERNRAGRKVDWGNSDQHQKGRIVSAPPQNLVERETRAELRTISSVKQQPRGSTSLPTSTPPTTASSSLQSRRGTVSQHAPSAVPTSPIPEEEEQEEVPHNSVDLTWALRPHLLNPASVHAASEMPQVTDAERIEGLRRELRELQLDVLRMGRGLKNEIRLAVQPLMQELKENRVVMESQRREIERLRRGY